MTMRRKMLLAACALGALALAGCNGGAEATPTPMSSATGVNLEVPDMEISIYQGADVLGGETLALSEVVALGQPVVLNFWAALCPPCRAEMPEFQRVYDEREAEVLVLGIDIGPQQFLGSREEGRALLADLGVHYPAGTTFNESIIRDYEILGMPTTLFIAADGSLVRSWSGLLSEDKLNELIDELVAA